MCGITGLVDNTASREAREALVARAAACLAHRGPDDAGQLSVGPATLGMRRLAIFDPAHGRQPMQTPDRRYTLVFNGAIYNFRALRTELAGHGYTFRTDCDTEVLLAAFVTWGERALARLRGMFAFAIWDAHEESLFLARDPFGIKPLYYRHAAGRFVFASELRALVESGACAPEIDPNAVSDYLAWLAVPAPRTIYLDVLSLRPGECATFQHGRLALRRFWSFGNRTTHTPCRSREEFTHELRARLEDTIRAHQLADVPVGAFLSGGLDSAAIVGLMTRASAQPLRTFSIAFPETEFSEGEAAAETARHFGTHHTTHTLTGAEVAGDIDRLLSAFDQPTGDGINTYYASRAARAGGVTVALSGLGGDELFGGYPSFRDLPKLNRWLPAWRTLPSPVRRTIANRLATGDTRRRKLADVLHHARTPHEVAALQRRVFALSTRDALLQPELRSTANGPFHPELATLTAELPDAGPFETASAWELRTYMSDVLLRDSDVMSMQHSLELRVPFVDRPLIEWLWAQPAAFKSDDHYAKHALYAAVRDLLPPAFATRAKRGFSLPFPVWMKRELRPFLDETFSSASLARADLFDRAAVQQLWHHFLAGHDTREWSRVWSLAVLVAFANRRAAAPVSAAARPSTTISAATTPALTGNTLLLAPEIFASEGGIPRILQSYLRALCDLSAPGAVRLLALNDDRIAAEHLRHCGDNPISEWRVCGRNKLKFVSAALRLSRPCDRIVCGHVAQLPVAWLAQQLNPKIKYYLVAHGIEVWRPFNAAELLALRGAERILCVSDYTRHELLKNCPLPAGRAIVLPNTLDASFAIAPGRPLAECPPTILVVTRLTYDDRYKGVEHMIAAMPAIRAAIPEARLRIVGRGDDLARLQQIAATAGVTDAVTFTGFVDDARLVEEIRSCRLFALPSKKEGFGLVFLEAMARGRPCLGARAGGVPEVISETTGVLIDYGNVPAIANAAITALRRDWNETAILARATGFAFPLFRCRCAEALAP